MPNQTAKADFGKPKLSLVPTQIIFDIARIREYGNEKYGDPDNWKTVEPERYRDAAYRHFLKYIEDPSSRDEESGLPHLWHWLCNGAFLAEMEKWRFKDSLSDGTKIEISETASSDGTESGNLKKTQREEWDELMDDYFLFFAPYYKRLSENESSENDKPIKVVKNANGTLCIIVE